MRGALLLTALSFLTEVAFATPQISDTVIFGGRKYALHEVPMLGLWDYGAQSAGTGKVVTL